MPILQLELNLWQQLAKAQQSPQAVDWQQLCLAFDEAIDRTPVNTVRLSLFIPALAPPTPQFWGEKAKN
jgi:hypothetical protein